MTVPRLPIPGSDDGAWGSILNDFLGQAHNSDGSIKPAALTAAGVYVKPAGGIPGADLSAAAQASLSKADSALQAAPVSSVAGKTGAVTLGPTDVGAVAAGALVLNVKDYGAKGDGTTNDSTAVAAALAAIPARGATLYFPPGVYMVNQLFTVPSNTRIIGAGKNATIIKKSAAVATALFDFSGSSTSSRCQRGGMMDLQLNGGNFTGPLVRAQYADHLNFDRVWFYQNGDAAVVAIELWDSYFIHCEFEWCGTTTYKSGAVVQLLGSATDSSNVIGFTECRWESFPGHALWIGNNGGTHPPYRIYLNECKMESAYVGNLSFIDMTNDVTDVHIRGIYIAADNLAAGFTSATSPNLINLIAASFCTIRGLSAYINNNAARTVIRFFAGGNNYVIEEVYVNAVTSLGAGIIEFAGGDPPTHIRNVRYQPGTGGAVPVYGGTLPSNVIIEDYAVSIVQDSNLLGLGSHYLNLPGSGGAYISTPSVQGTAAGQRVGVQTIDARVKVSLANWVPSANTFLLAKWSATVANNEYGLYIDTAGKVNFAWYRSGAVFTGTASSVATGLVANATSWIRAVCFPNTGYVIYYTSSDGLTWTQLGTIVTNTAGAVQLPTSAQPLTIGGTASATGLATGKVYAAQVLINGGTQAAADFSQQTASATTISGVTGETWTVQGTAAII